MQVNKNFQLIGQCRGCLASASALAPVLTMDPMPLAGVFCATDTEAKAAPRFPLTWVTCERCGLVQVQEEIDDSLLFHTYHYASSSVGGLVRHFQEYSSFLSDRYGRERSVSFLEIGCNDGVLLSRLPATWRLLGVDPSDVAQQAHEQSPTKYELASKCFNSALVDELKLHNSLDVVSGSNCLAHISQIHDVFAGVHQALRRGGHFWLEVHNLGDLLSGSQWDTIYHEHKMEWSEGSLVNCLSALGFRHVETLHRPLHGGLLRICFEKSAGNSSDFVTPKINQQLLHLKAAYEMRYQTAAARMLADEVAAGRVIGAYGAAGRANVYLNQLSQIPFAFIVDEAPLRVGRFLPHVATPIVAPKVLWETQPRLCLITAWNYAKDIQGKNSQFTGSWLTAFEAE